MRTISCRSIYNSDDILFGAYTCDSPLYKCVTNNAIFPSNSRANQFEKKNFLFVLVTPLSSASATPAFLCDLTAN